ncbi:MAG: molybdate ABC transporter substrate-binding protein [Alphaproteobacteria bacterium]
MKPFIWRNVAHVGTVLAVALWHGPSAAKDSVTVFAAASLTNALQEIGTRIEASSDARLVFSFAASSLLAKQIESGGKVDIFFSSDPAWMDYLESRGLIAHGTRRNLLGNRLVLIEPAERATRLRIANEFRLKDALGRERLALADPESVPAGYYAREALAALGVWESVRHQLAPAENVRVALAYVARGETPFGIVYETDARIEPRVRVVGTFQESTHAPIVYPLALTKDARPGARSVYEFFLSREARKVFVKYGFTVLQGA